MALGPLPSPGPFGRIVDVRVWPHGFTTEQGAIVRPNIEDAAWHAGAGKWAGNIVWTGSTPRHTIAYNGPRGRYFGPLSAGSFRAMKTWFAHNGAKVDAPSGLVLAACVKTYDSLPTSQAYAGTGDGTLDVQTPSTAPGALTGDYEIRCIEAAPVPRFLVTGPDAQPIGVAEAGPLLGAPVLFDGVVRFTLQAGSVAFVVGDTWTLTAEEAEQFVVITTPDLDATPRTETVWRRGVSLTPGSSWRQLATIAPVSGQVDGSIQPWFFNASATLAVTCRGLGEDAGGFTLGTVGRSLNLGTLAVSDTVSSGGKITYTTTLTTTDSEPHPADPSIDRALAKTVINATAAGGPFDQLMARDFVSDSMIELSIRLSGSVEGSADFTDVPSEPQGLSLTGGYSVLATMVWTGGGPAELVLFSMSGSGSYTQLSGGGGFGKDRSLTFEHRSLRDIAGPDAAAVAFTAYEGVNSVEQDGGTGDYYETASGVMLSHSVAGSSVANVTGGSGPLMVTETIATNYWVQVIAHVNDSVENDSWTEDFAALRGLSSAWALRVMTFQSEIPGDPVLAGGGLPSANASTGRGLQTSAQDTRGNWLMTAEVAAFGTTDMSYPGSISASGTYTLQAGGPDTLTAAQVASLTAYAPHDRWNIGAF